MIFVFNITNRDILIDDLGIRVEHLKCVNLSNIPKEVLLKSMKSGSLFKKKDFLVLRNDHKVNLKNADRHKIANYSLPDRVKVAPQKLDVRIDGLENLDKEKSKVFDIDEVVSKTFDIEPKKE